MNISREKLLQEAQTTGFQAAVLEKVLHLIALLEGVNRHPFLAGKLALKGGTALNLFLFDLPRLSVDIDLNYIGAEGREAMLNERQKIIDSVSAVCRREGLTLRTTREEHTGVTWHLRYASALGQRGNLKIDLNFMFRVTLWPVVHLNSHQIGSAQATDIILMDLHELAAGKLAALLSRHTSRDLFDAHELLVRGIPNQPLDPVRLRLAFLVYGAINREDWRTVRAEDIAVAMQDLETYLLPLLRTRTMGDLGPQGTWGRHLMEACNDALVAVLPLSETELAFLDRLLDAGEIEPALLTADADLADRLLRHPGLAWKAQNVRSHKFGKNKPSTNKRTKNTGATETRDSGTEDIEII